MARSEPLFPLASPTLQKHGLNMAITIVIAIVIASVMAIVIVIAQIMVIDNDLAMFGL